MRNLKTRFANLIDNIDKIAQLPDQRKLWLIRKIHGNLPPTDPRFLSMTKEQIELDLTHYYFDLKETNKKESDSFIDEEFDKFDEESDEIDRKVTDYYDFNKKPLSATGLKIDDWEEIDDE